VKKFTEIGFNDKLLEFTALIYTYRSFIHSNVDSEALFI